MMVIESMMSGAPVVAFDIGVLRDLIKNCETVRKVSKINSSDMAEKIVAFLRIPDEERERVPISCRDLALKISSVEVQVDSFTRPAEIY